MVNAMNYLLIEGLFKGGVIGNREDLGLGINPTPTEFERVLLGVMGDGSQNSLVGGGAFPAVKEDIKRHLVDITWVSGNYVSYESVYIYPSRSYPGNPFYLLNDLNDSSGVFVLGNQATKEENFTPFEVSICENFSCQAPYQIAFLQNVNANSKITEGDNRDSSMEVKTIDLKLFLENINKAIIENINSVRESKLLKDYYEKVFFENLNRGIIDNINSTRENLFIKNQYGVLNINEIVKDQITTNNIKDIIMHNGTNQIKSLEKNVLLDNFNNFLINDPINAYNLTKSNFINYNELLVLEIDYFSLNTTNLVYFSEEKIKQMLFLSEYLRDYSILNAIDRKDIDYGRIVEKINDIIEIILNNKKPEKYFINESSQSIINITIIHHQIYEEIGVNNNENAHREILFENILSNLVLSSIDKNTGKLNLDTFNQNLIDVHDKVITLYKIISNIASNKNLSVKISQITSELYDFIKNNRDGLLEFLNLQISKKLEENNINFDNNSQIIKVNTYLTENDIRDITSDNQKIKLNLDSALFNDNEFENVNKLLKEITNNYNKLITEKKLLNIENTIKRNTIGNLNSFQLSDIEDRYTKNYFHNLATLELLDLQNSYLNNLKTNEVTKTNQVNDSINHINFRIINKEDLIDHLQNNLFKGIISKKTIIHLHPPELGKIKIDVEIRNNEIKTIFTVENNEIKELLSKTIDTLKTNLENKGFITSEIVIKNHENTSINTSEMSNFSFTNSNNANHNKNQNKKQFNNLNKSSKEDDERIKQIDNKSISIII